MGGPSAVAEPSVIGSGVGPGIEAGVEQAPAAGSTEMSETSGEFGAPGEFEAFYRGQADRVYRALAVTLGNAQLAREATDEAMLRAYARWFTVRRCDNPGGWVYRVGLNWATSWWRKARRERPLVDDGRHPSVAPPDPAATAAVSALHGLPLGQRAVVVCRVLLDLSTAETAAVLGIAEGTVKSRLTRALAALRSALQDREDQ